MKAERILLCLCAVFAIFAARPFAGSWNDASRLATAESVVERGTLCIDDSIFVSVPTYEPGKPLPYPADRADLLTHGTQDKLYIAGHFYSDKTPLPSLYLAGVYEAWRWVGGPTAAERPDWFCRIATWASSGIAFVFAVAGALAIGRVIGLSTRMQLELAIAFAAGTMTVGYAGTVNAHILQLAAAIWLFVGLLQFDHATRRVRRLAGLGTLVGIAYAADASAGPTLLVATTIAVLGMTRRVTSVGILLVSASPWLLGHHAVNYWVGGSFAPANANPEYFYWDGSPFVNGKITGRWQHSTPLHFILYCGDLLFGKQGFLFHNLPLLLASAWAWPVWKLAKRERWVLLAAGLWCMATFLLAAVSSTNRSGQRLSIRWFLPLLAAGFVYLAVLLRNRPDLIPDFRLLAIWGVPLAAMSAIYGLWIPHMIPGYWGIVALALISWLVMKIKRGKMMLNRTGAFDLTIQGQNIFHPSRSKSISE